MAEDPLAEVIAEAMQLGPWSMEDPVDIAAAVRAHIAAVLDDAEARAHVSPFLYDREFVNNVRAALLGTTEEATGG